MSGTFNDFENENINYPKTTICSQLKFCGLGYSLVERNCAHELVDAQGLVTIFFLPSTLKTTREESKMSNFHTTLFQNSFVLVS